MLVLVWVGAGMGWYDLLVLVWVGVVVCVVCWYLPTRLVCKYNINVINSLGFCGVGVVCVLDGGMWCWCCLCVGWWYKRKERGQA